MSRKGWVVAAGLSCLAVFASAAQERVMGVRQEPASVFSEPVDRLLPELAGATATGENGRVGGELVFWGYMLRDGKPVFLFACARSETVNCDERVQLICPARTNVLRSSTTGGDITRRTCRFVATAAPGDTRPGCTDNLEPAELAIGLVSCG
jgi:hypothetical protein